MIHTIYITAIAILIICIYAKMVKIVAYRHNLKEFENELRLREKQHERVVKAYQNLLKSKK